MTAPTLVAGRRCSPPDACFGRAGIIHVYRADAVMPLASSGPSGSEREPLGSIISPKQSAWPASKHVHQ
jgi:hypothetical protein